jgi:hypothetical protein
MLALVWSSSALLFVIIHDAFVESARARRGVECCNLLLAEGCAFVCLFVAGNMEAGAKHDYDGRRYCMDRQAFEGLQRSESFAQRRS